jgi:hypothetical protein
MTIELREWRSQLLARRGLECPDGRMLYQYRLTTSEFDALKEALRQTCAGHQLAGIAESNLTFPAAFVAFGAEWWKREYSGGVWSWPLIIEAFGADPDSWFPNQRTASVLSGLRFWGHTVHRAGRAYLGSVITQGGIPQVLLSGGHGAITGLLVSAGRRASRLNARGDEIVAIVRDYQDRLQQSLQREEVIELIAKTIEAVLDLQHEFALQGSAEECIKKLDSVAPDWKDRFPLPLENAATATLLRRLIDEVIDSGSEAGTSQFTIERFLRQSKGHYQLTSKLIQPATISAQQLGHLLGQAEDTLPRYVTFEMETTQRELISEARRLLGASQAAFSLSIPRKYWVSDEAASEHLLYAHFSGSAAAPLALPGGAELDLQMPWVFADDEGVLRLQGVGSQRVRSDSAWVCYPEDWILAPAEDSSTEAIGSLELGETRRPIVRITGECRIHGPDDARYRIRTGQAGVESNQYVWQGQRLGFASNPRQVFLGLPRLNCHTPDGVRQIAKSEIEWRRAGSQQVFGSEFQVTGPVDAIFRVDGETVFRTRMVVLDRTVKLAFQSGQTGSQGVIKFQGDWGIQHLGMESAPASARVEALLAGWQVTIDSAATAPETVSFILDWERSIVPLRLLLPVPVSGGRFFKSTGEAVSNGEALAPRELIGSRLRILDSNPDRPMIYAIQLRLMVGRQQIACGEMHRIQLIGNSAEVRLFDYQPEIESLLSGSDALDALVELVLWVGNQPWQKISVKRYDCALDPYSNGVALSQADIQQLSSETLRGIKVLGTRLHDFSQPAVDFVQIESEGVPGGRWFPRNLVSDSGPIFVYPSPESCLQFRPMLLPGHSPDSDPPVVEEGLAAAVLLPDPEARRGAMDRALTAMATDLRHPDWKLVESMWRVLGHLPLSSLDFWRRLVAHPDALVAFTVRPWDDSPSEPATLCRRFTQELGLIWEAVPISAWRKGFRGLRSYWWDTLGGDTAKQVFLLDIDAKVSAIKGFCPALSFLIDLLAWEVTGKKSADHHQMRNLRLGMGEASLCNIAYEALWSGEDSHLQQVLLHQHIDTQWPSGLSDKVIAELLQRPESEALLRAHARKILWITDDHKANVANLPVLLAFSLSTEGLSEWWFRTEVRAALKRHHDFDPDWFKIAFEHGIRMSYALNLLKFQPVSQQ